MRFVLYSLFFCSGFSGLIYQVVWVRVFGNVFGNTIYSASLVIAVFMLGLGLGSYIVGVWADRRYAETASDRATLLRTYGYVELLIGLLGFGIAVVLPRLGALSAIASSYVADAAGWYVLSPWSHLAHGGVAIILLAPITVLMGGTLTLLIRHLVGEHVEFSGRRIAALYAVNTAGAAFGCFLTDVTLVPAYGLNATQMVAVAFNLVAGVGALALSRARAQKTAGLKRGVAKARKEPGDACSLGEGGEPDQRALVLTSIALALIGFAAMGMEILWFRHFIILLGEFRAVLSLLLTVILVGIGLGSCLGGVVERRSGQPASWLIAVQGLFIASTLLGLAAADAAPIRDAGIALQRAGAGTLQELWFNARPILLEVGVPALLMGFSFPLGNTLVQRVTSEVGRRAGLLYLCNTAGAVAGSLMTGFLLLPTLGIQRSATALMAVAAVALISLYGAARRDRVPVLVPAGSLLVAAAALGFWLLLPPGHVMARAQLLARDTERLITMSEGITEVIAVTSMPGRGRMLLTNGHPMSATDPLSQRYMRALAHIPLLSIDRPEHVLVMCFGVGNTAHAATLHPSVRRVEVVDLSRHVLAHAPYFRDTNRDVLNDARVAVFVNDGRHHLYMQREVAYDLITLEPPPVTHAGMGALYSREFYDLARTRLKPGGYLSQWLPVGSIPAEATLSMIRAFIDVFPQTVLLSGAHTNLLLVGVNGSRIEIDPARLQTALANAPDARADLQLVDLGTVREIVGTFVASAETLKQATRQAFPASDDRPIQEYGVRSLVKTGEPPPSSIVDLSQAPTWCPACFADGRPVPVVDGLDTYFALLDLVYRGSPNAAWTTEMPGGASPRVIAGSGYLGAVVPESAALHNVLGTALAARGAATEAIAEFRRAAELDPADGRARNRLATALLESGRYDEAAQEFRAALQLLPDLVEARNNLGVSLASQGKLDEAIEQFQQALRLQPEFADARRNLTLALQKRRPAL